MNGAGAADGATIFGSAGARPALLPTIGVAAAALLSGVAVWLPTGSAALTGGFVGAGLLGAALIWALHGRAQPVEAVDEAGNDWGLVRSVAEAAGNAVAITDRTGRLVCANDIYCDWFGGAVTPPGLPVDAGTAALLADAGSTAWRDGEAAVADFSCAGHVTTGIVTRIGRGSDHLLWQWQRHVASDAVADASVAISGSVGKALGEAGVMAAVTSAAGTIRAANAAFRLRATGDLYASIEGHDFAGLLKLDSSGLIRFSREREGEGATPLRILEVPFDASTPASPLVLLLIDEEGGAADRGVALDYVENLLSALPFGMAMVDRDGRFLFINRAFAEVAAAGPGEAIHYPGDLLVSEDKAAIGEAIRRHAAGRGSSGTIAVRLRSRPDASATIGLHGVRGIGQAAVLLTLQPEAGDSDIKQQMVQATKMQAVGQLAGGIAHDFNNILTAIIGSCDLMLARHTAGDTDYDDIQQIRSNSNRAANLTRQLLAFSRQQTLRPQILNLSDIVADVSHLLQRLLGERIALDVQHGRGLGPVRADPVQLEQVIVNLAVNARDAMPQGGKLPIATAAVGPADISTAGGPAGGEGMPPGAYSLLSVSDTGSGIAPEVLPKIFEPFFTTKDVGKGTGLGLATVYGIVKQSGGYIFAESERGQGTRFSIYLPVHHGAAEAEPAPKPPAVARSLHWGSGTILLVEDEDMVRAVAERALVRAGYSVISAAHGEEGLERFVGTSDIDLVVSDVMMPQMDGPAMVEAIRARRADVPVLFMSGYAEEQLRQTIAMPNVAFLAKPFSVAQLVDAVATIRDASS